MPTFAYSAKNDTGANVRGTMVAVDVADVGRRLQTQHLYLLECETGESDLDVGGPIKVEELVEFATQLRMLLQAGLPLVKGLEVIEEESPESLRGTLRDVRMRLMSGSSVGDALAAHPVTFPDIFVNILRAGEGAGTFDVALDNAVRFVESREALRKTIKDALLYPVTLLVASFGVLILLTTFVFPKILALVSNLQVELALPTRMIMALSAFMRTFGPWILAVLVLALIGNVIAGRFPASKIVIDRHKLRVPMFGELIVRLELARFARAAGPMLGAGVDVLRVIDAGATTVSNSALRDAFRRARLRIESGRLLSEALTETGVFPRLFLTLLRVGESTGGLDTTFARTAEIYEREVQQRIKKGMAVFQPAVLVFLGSVVTITALALFMTIQSVMRQSTLGK